MPFKSDKQRKWMWANDPEMAKKWEKEEQKEAVQVNVDKVLKNPKIKKLMKRLGIKQAQSYKAAMKILNYLANNPQALSTIKYAFETVKEERDYKAEYKKYGSSTKAKKYRAELNQYNRKKGTYGNGDGKDASHKGGKIVGFEAESKNRGRAEKSRLKQESVNERKLSSYQKKAILIAIEMSGNMTGATKKIEKIKKGLSNDKKVKDALRLANESVNEATIVEFSKYRLGGLLNSKLKKRLERTIRIIGGKVDAVGDDYIKFRIGGMDLKRLPAVITKLDRNKNVWIGDKLNKNIWDRKRKIDRLESVEEMLNPPNYLDNQAPTPVNSPEDENLVSRGKRTKKSGQPKFGTFRNESINEKISKDEWAQYPAYARKLKPYMRRLLKIPVKVRVIKQANHNPWIEIRVARFGKDVIPNDFRVKAAKNIGARGVRDWDNVNYGNITAGSVSMYHSDWVKLLGNKVK